MASDAAPHVTRSPWWYRNRAITIGGVYFAGFFLGPVVSSLVHASTLPIVAQVGVDFGRNDARIVLIAAMFLAFACWATRCWGAAYLRPEVVWSADALDDRLIVAGPFAFVRNPLYLGNVFLALSMATFATPLGAVAIIAGNLAVIARLVTVEQRLLRTRYGAAFETYEKAVPALVPRLWPAKNILTADVKPSLRLGARSEIFSAAFVVYAIAVAVYFW